MAERNAFDARSSVSQNTQRFPLLVFRGCICCARIRVPVNLADQAGTLSLEPLDRRGGRRQGMGESGTLDQEWKEQIGAAKHVSGDVLTIPGTKTDAAVRKVPLHSAIKALVERLVTSSKDGGHLIPVATQNQYDERSAPIGKRFGRMKAEMGFGPEHVFHSTRKTVATLLEAAQCSEGIAADILGHDKPTMTYGLYSGGSSMATRREWIEKAIHY
jgi:hypothetical protein